MRQPLRVTLDTGALHPKTLVRIETAIAEQDVELDHATVSARERPYPPPQPAGLPELLVVDESRVGEAVLAGEEDAALFEAILEVISDRGFPPPGGRDDLSAGQLHQLRDAMILEAHSRSERHVFVTTDLKGFVKHGRREKLQELCSTVIVTVDEFIDQLDNLMRATRD